MKTKTPEKTEAANVADLSRFRAQKLFVREHVEDRGSGIARRVRRARATAFRRFTEHRSPVIAYAGILLSQDGTITLHADGIEPEFVPAITTTLDQLSRRIESHAKSHRGRPRRNDGFCRLLPLLSLAFIGATYINDVAWIDAALSLAAQATVGLACSRCRRRHQ